MEKLCYFDDASHNHETSPSFRSNSKKKNYLSLSGLIFVISLLIPGFSAYAQCITQDFSSVITGPVSAPETWFPDRFAVAFTAGETSPDGRTNTLKHAIASADKQVVGGADEQSGNNTQGRQYQLPNGTKVIQADLFIANGWSTSSRRMAGLWGVALNGVSAVSAYPIIEYISNGTAGKFRGYEGVTSNAWKDITLPGSIPDNSWVTLKIELLPNGEFTYSVNELSYTTTVFTTEGSQSLGTAIFQGHNTNAGVSYNIYWDNFKAGPTSGLVQNTNTGKLFCTIQSAIDDATTFDGHTIKVWAGSYTENITVNKALSINGPNVLSAGTSNARAPEAILLNGSLSVTTSGTAVVSGFHISQTNNSADVFLLGGSSATTIENNIFERNGTTAGQMVRAITTSDGSGVKTIKNNLFTGNTSGGLFSGHLTWQSAMYVNGANSTVSIEGNTFKNVRAALNLDDFQANISVLGNIFENSGTYISFGGTIPTQGSHTLGVNNFKTPVSTFMNLSNVNPNFRINIASSNYNGVPFPNDLATLFAIESTMFHRGRSGRNGLVTFVNGKEYVVAGLTTIQSAVDYGSVNDAIHVKDGSYNERVSISKALDIIGQSKTSTILEGAGLTGSGSGFNIPSGITDISIQNFTIQNFTGSSGNTHAGIYANGGNNNLIVNNVSIKNNPGASGIYANGPVENVLIDGIESLNHGAGARGIVIWNGFKKNITIKNSEIKNNSCCGIELQDGTASGILIQNNTIEGNDNAIGVIGLTSGSGTSNANVIENNTITVKGRFGIEVKNPQGTGLTSGDGAIILRNNTITFVGGLTDARDLAGIAIYRRGVLAGNVDVPVGVVVTGNTIKDFTQSSLSDGFGIVIEGLNHTITGNSLQGNDVALQQQAGYGGYPGDGDQANLNDTYFGRGNSPFTCGNTINGNLFTSNTIDTRNVGTSGAGFVVNTSQSTTFCSIQAAINAANPNDEISVPGALYSEVLTINKSLILKGANSGTCGTETRVTETILVAPVTAEPGMIQLSGPVNVSFDGFKFDGTGIAYITGVDQELSIKNSVLELDFLTDKNNLYFSSKKLTLECNYFQAIAGTNNLGNASHLLYGGQELEVKNNKFTSLAARSSISVTSTSLPVWINLTTNANNVSIEKNNFYQIDMGVLIASNAGNVRIENNEFYDALRQNIPFGSGMGAGIGLFQDLAPAAPILITKNKFIAGETGIRTSGNGTSFPAPGLLTISYNSFESQIDKAISLGSTYSGSTNKLNALCNWFGAINGPIISTNAGAGGTQILDAGGKVSFRNWLVYGDATPGQIGFQTPTAFTVSSPGTPTVAGNDYRILSNAIGCALENQEITLSGSFDYTHATTLAEWAKGNDGDASSTGDNYSILAPVNLNGVKLIGASSATITGPGDLPNTNLEKFLAFNNGYNRNWDISGLTIKDFDVSIGFFSTANYPTNNSGLKIHNNTFYIPKDLNATVAPADVNQNIGINLANGANQIIENNTVYIDGTGESNGTTALSTSIFLQSTTTGGNGYDGLRIRNNIVQVKGEPQTEPNQAVIRGIWENSQSTASDIEISGNVFNNEPGLNTANLNRQFAFWITSRSGAGKPVVYKNNEVTGYEEGIGWLGGLFTANTAPNYEATATPVTIENNKFTNVKNGVVVRKAVSSPNTGSPAIISNNSFTGIATGGFAIVNQSTGETNAECNWYDTPIAANAISSTGGGTVKFNPKLSTGTDNDVAIGFQPVPNSCILPVLNYTTSTYYPTIQSAIDAAETLAGNEIRVSAGIYPENVLVNKGVLIVGADSANVIIDKGAANFGAAGGAGFRLAADGITLSKMKVQNFNNGIETETATTGVTIDAMNLNMNYSNGFFGKRSATDLTIRNSNLNSNGVTPGGAQTGSYMRGFMFEAQANAIITKLIITNNNFKSNGLVGIDISSLIPVNGIDINANRVWDNFDSQIGVSLGNNSLTGEPVSISTNNLKVSGSARFGIEVKNPLGNGTASGSGSIVVAANTIAVVNQTPGGTARDLAAIAVMRRKGGYASITDQPQGVRVIGNIISDFQNPGAGDAFGIVLGGTGHYVANNTITNTNYSIQLQKGNENFNSDNDSGNNTNEYFERDNSGDVCVEIGANSIDGISGVPRIVTGASATSTTLPVTRVSNLTLAGSSKFCTIQQAINFTATTTGHVLDALAGDYPENVVVNKSVTLQGPNNAVSGSGLRAGEAVIIPGLDDVSGGTLVRIEANNVNVKGFAIDGSNTAFAPNIIINGAQTHAAYGITAFGEITGLNVSNNIIKNISKHGIDLNANNGSTQNNEINGNLFDNIPRFSASGSGFYGRGILLANNFYASVKNNKFTRVERGIQTNNFSKAILGGQWEISGNDIKAYNIGSFINLHYQATSDLLFENNIIEKDATTRTISTTDALPDEDFTGVEVFSISNTASVTLKGGTITNAAQGVYSWNNSSSNHVTVDGVAFSNNAIAVLQSNFSRYSGAADSEIHVKNVTITAGNAVKAFVAEDHASGSGAISAINMVTGNVLTSSGTFTHPFHLQGGLKARIKAGGTAVTSSSVDAFTFDIPAGTSSIANVIIQAGLSVTLGGSSHRVINLPAGLVMQMDGDFTPPNKITDNPVLINGALWFNSGILNSGDGSIEFGNTAADIMTGPHAEKVASYILGKALMASRAVGGDAIDMLGVKMMAGPSVGNLVITRTTKTSGSIMPAFPGDGSIRTVWDITPSITSASRGDVQFRYLDLSANINSQNPSEMFAYRYNTGTSQWEKKSALRSSELDGNVYTIQTFGIAEFSSWTLSSGATGPDLIPFIEFNNIQFTSAQTSRPVTFTIYNDRPANATTGTITIRLYRPTLAATFALTGTSIGEWTVTTPAANYYLLTATNPMTINTLKEITATLTVPGSTAIGNYNVRVLIPDTTGGEVTGDNGNNEALTFITKN